jgi:hypothetical protein
MHRLIIGGLLLAVLGLVTPNRAEADSSTDTFTYSIGSNTFIWQLPASPTIGIIYEMPAFLPGLEFVISDVPYTENGVAQTPTYFGFFSTYDGGGFGVFFPAYYPNTYGAQLYSGPESAPTFLLGTYELNEGLGGPLGTLVISTVVSTPEPGSPVLIGVGLVGLIGLRKSAAA